MDRLSVFTWRIPLCKTSEVEASVLSRDAAVESLDNIEKATGAKEIFYLSTCQRVLYALWSEERGGVGTDRFLRALREASFMRDPARVSEPERFDGQDAFAHLCEIASSLDSLTPGEPQVLGQVRDAFRFCISSGVAGPRLKRVLSEVLRVAKQVRATPLFEGKVSIVSLIEDVVKSHLAEYMECSVAIIGTGAIGRKVLNMLGECPRAKVWIVSHHEAHARRLAEEGRAVPMDLQTFFSSSPQVDMIILASDVDAPFFTREVANGFVARRRLDEGPLLVLDLGLPRNSEPDVGKLEGCKLYQMDDFAKLAEDAREARRGVLVEARAVLEAELSRVSRDWFLGENGGQVTWLRERFLETAEERLAELERTEDLDHLLQKESFLRWYDKTVKRLLHLSREELKRALLSRDGALRLPHKEGREHE